MISIRRYMEIRAGDDFPEPAPLGSPVFFFLCLKILEHIGAYVFTGEFAGFRPQLDNLKHELEPVLTDEEGERANEHVRAVLAAYSTSVRETIQSTAIEMQQIAGVLGQALTLLSSGTDRSVSRLQKVRETLQHAATIENVAVLRASLASAVQLIRDEIVREQQTAAHHRERFETEVGKIREMFSCNPNRALPGRAECVRTVSDSLRAVLPGRALYAVAFSIHGLTELVQRYGPAAVDDLFLLLIRERLQPAASAVTAYRWTGSSLVGLFQAGADTESLKSEIAALNRKPLVYRVELGNRTAVVKVGLSHMVVDVTAAGTDALVTDIDRFTGFQDIEGKSAEAK